MFHNVESDILTTAIGKQRPMHGGDAGTLISALRLRISPDYRIRRDLQKVIVAMLCFVPLTQRLFTFVLPPTFEICLRKGFDGIQVPGIIQFQIILLDCYRLADFLLLHIRRCQLFREHIVRMRCKASFVPLRRKVTVAMLDRMVCVQPAIPGSEFIDDRPDRLRGASYRR
jgi:hypothetical protein